MQPDDGRVVSNFIVQALLGLRHHPSTAPASRRVRSALLSDLVDRIIRLMAFPGDIIAPVNLGNPAEITVGELAKIIVGLGRQPVEGCLSAAARGRSPAAPTRHRSRKVRARLGPKGRASGRPARDDRLLLTASLVAISSARPILLQACSIGAVQVPGFSRGFCRENS